MPTITSPFARGRWYTFDEFLAFEEGLLVARRADQSFDADLKLNRQRWIKLRNEELYPAWHFCRHVNLPRSTQFRIGSEGAETDIEIRTADCARPLQITTAGPLWPGGPTNWGVDHMLSMEQLTLLGQSSGWGPYRRQADGPVINRDEMISTSERNAAYGAGIRQALIGKRNQHSDCELIVYAATYDEAMTLEDFAELATSALRSVPLSGFVAIHVLAASENYFVSDRGPLPN